MSITSDQMLLNKVSWLKLQIIQFNDPDNLAALAGLDFICKGTEQFFEFDYFNHKIKLTYPELTAIDYCSKEVLSVGNQAVINYYCYHSILSIPIPLQYEWISFSDLIDGRIYNTAFQGYTGDLLAIQSKKIVNNFNNIQSALRTELMDFGDFSFQSTVLPNISIALVIWLEDEEFPSSCRLLFNNAINSFLPTDACAIIGSMFTHKVLQQLKE